MCAFYCFICNDYHSSQELGGFIGGKPVCEMQLALSIALGDDLDGQEVKDIRTSNYTTVGKEELLLKRHSGQNLSFSHSVSL